MEHLGTKRQETDRLVLRAFTIEDAGYMFRNWASDDEVTKYLTWPTHRSEEDSKAILREWVASYADKRTYQWAIAPKQTSEPIGSISVVGIDDERSSVEIGYCIGRARWGKGIATEALQKVIDFFFTEVGAEQVTAKHDVENPASGRVMQKCGMHCVGVKKATNNRGIVDVCEYVRRNLKENK